MINDIKISRRQQNWKEPIKDSGHKNLENYKDMSIILFILFNGSSSFDQNFFQGKQNHD